MACAVPTGLVTEFHLARITSPASTLFRAASTQLGGRQVTTRPTMLERPLD